MTLTTNDLWWLIPLAVWELAWKSLALWRAAGRNQPAWFGFMLVINSVGLLPIIYLLANNDKKSPPRRTL